MKDLATPKFEWDHPQSASMAEQPASKCVTCCTDPYQACHGAHAIAVLTGQCSICAPNAVL